MSRTIASLLGDWRETRSWLERDGWKTPQTYCNFFDEITDIPSVYLFACVDQYEFKRGFVGYVGMSTRLAQRISGHNIKAQLDDLDMFVMTWFKPTDRQLLRETEREFIRKFDPPWNVIGRRRGVSV